MQASMTINVNVFNVSANNAMIINNGHSINKNTTMTQPLLPPMASETTPTMMPPGIIPKSYNVEIMFAVSGSKCVCKNRGNLCGTDAVATLPLYISTRREDSHEDDIDARWYRGDAIAATASGSSSISRRVSTRRTTRN